MHYAELKKNSELHFMEDRDKIEKMRLGTLPIIITKPIKDVTLGLAKQRIGPFDRPWE
jgi:hypothetical protein